MVRGRALPVTLTNTSQSHTVFSPNTAKANLRIFGTPAQVQGGNGVTPTWSSKYTWLNTGSSADFEFMATALSGTTPAGTFGSYNDAGSAACAWSLTRSTNGTSTGAITITCRRKSDSAIMGTFTMTFTATRNA